MKTDFELVVETAARIYSAATYNTELDAVERAIKIVREARRLMPGHVERLKPAEPPEDLFPGPVLSGLPQPIEPPAHPMYFPAIPEPVYPRGASPTPTPREILTDDDVPF